MQVKLFRRIPFHVSERGNSPKKSRIPGGRLGGAWRDRTPCFFGEFFVEILKRFCNNK
ncbi:hypothetical protein B4135_1183 [Caldibacillus debilis]|uniref:Uncharacterized protein n=1 Tax=Caldibacillus debilis TaxID=301148 RepID=A0A150MDQ6_9BACI|nr:hypothetical protein B4135_1183 [Caldibacillus debilis]